MDSGLVRDIALIAVSVCFSAYFSAAEMAVLSMNEVAVKLAFKEYGEKAKSLELWMTNPNRVLNTILAGNNIVNMLAAVLAAKVATGLFTGAYVAVVIGIVIFIILFFGEVMPKTFAKSNAAVVAIYSMKFLRVFYILFYPLTWAMSAASTIVAKISGNAGSKRPKITEDELEFLINVGEKEGVLEKGKGEMITNIFDISDIQVREVMVPRIDIVAVPENITKEALVSLIGETEFSRIPVYKESLDDITGILYVKDIIKMKGKDYKVQDLMKFVREPLFVPETKKIDVMLKDFQKNRLHMAVVVDEYGGTAGIITMEDILEEIVGDIFDEYDEEDAEIVKVSEGVYLVDARMNIDDFCKEFGIEKTDDMSEYETLGGFVLYMADEMPSEGDSFEWNQYHFTVREMKDRSLERIEVSKIQPAVVEESGE